MFVHPQFDPVAVNLGPLSVRWYGLMYLIGFAAAWLLGRYRASRPGSGWTPLQVDDLVTYMVLGVVVGGRLGYMLFYDLPAFLANPLSLVQVWQGGMSFHGGFLGVLAVVWFFGRKTGKGFWGVADFTAPLAPFGIFAGRIGNFINGELWGRVADPNLPWAMIFPQSGDMQPRHPSQLYHVGLEGLALFAILWLYSRQPRPRAAVSGVFLIGYGSFRFITEFFREPDHGIFGQSYTISMGQWLSLPMILTGVAMLVFAYRKKPL